MEWDITLWKGQQADFPTSRIDLQIYCGRVVAGVVVDKSGSTQNFPEAGELSHN